MYGKESTQYRGFKNISKPVLINILKSYAAQEEVDVTKPSSLLNLSINQTQTTSVQQHISHQVHLNIEYSDLNPIDKEKAKELLNEIEDEVKNQKQTGKR